jgi:VWFA-related protein
MMRSIACATFLAAVTLAAQQQQPSPVPGTFRSTIALVPVDIRVLDRSGKPVTDLTQADFTILEDGVRQEVRHFSKHALVPEEQTAVTAVRDAGAVAELAPQRKRTFLIVLGRGRLEGPSKGVTATVAFLRERLLPQDVAAVLAYNRATDFTTDRAQLTSVLERFRDAHHDIEARLAHGSGSGLSGLFGGKSIPEKVQTKIDAIFAGPGGPGFRTVPPGRVTDRGRIAQDYRRGVDIRLNTDVTASGDRLPDPTDPSRSFDTSLDEYLLNHSQTMTDLENIYTGIEYLRYLEGEKHLVFITERGLFLPRLEDDTSIAAMANDARVVLDTIQTGGLSGGEPATAYRAAGVPGPSFTETFAMSTLRTMAGLTGGHASIYAYADRAVDRIDGSTRFQYLLGYAPTNASWDGRYRRIQVKVNRPDVTVASRSGYYGRQQLVPYNREEFLTFSRVQAAALYPDEIRDIKVKVKPTLQRGSDGEGDAVIDLTIDISRLALEPADSGRTVELTVAIYCNDADGKSTGDAWKKIRVTVPEDQYEQTRRKGVEYTIRVAAKNSSKHLKVVVYDYRADVAGSVVTQFY